MSYAPESARELRKVGTWLHDSAGRYVLLRGVNLGSRAKRAPYLAIYPVERADLDAEVFRADLRGAGVALDLLPRLGFNVVRLLVMWKALEPTPLDATAPLSGEALAYLDCVREILDALWARGLYTFIDIHQDIAHEFFGGDGFPDWAIPDDAPCEAVRPTRSWGGRYELDQGVRRTLRAFWDSDLTNAAAGLEHVRVQDHYAATARRLAAHLRYHPAVLGYELFNEPNGVGIQEDVFEGARDWAPGSGPSSAILPSFYRNVIGQIRAVDPDAFIFVEPRVDWTVYGPHSIHLVPDAREPSTQLALSARDDHRLVFSFHHYDPWTITSDTLFGHGDPMQNKEREWPVAFAAMSSAASYRGLVPFVTEHGADMHWARHPSDIHRPSYRNDQARAYIDLQFRQLESYLLSSTYWNFDLYNTAGGGDGWNGEDFSMLGPQRRMRNEDIQCRPFPHRSAARPVLLSFDVDQKLFVLVLEDPPAAAPSIVYLPQALHYGGGFEVHATGASMSWDAARQLLTWEHNRAETSHVLVITPPGAPFPPAWPPAYAELAGRPATPTLVQRFP